MSTVKQGVRTRGGLVQGQNGRVGHHLHPDINPLPLPARYPAVLDVADDRVLDVIYLEQLSEYKQQGVGGHNNGCPGRTGSVRERVARHRHPGKGGSRSPAGGAGTHDAPIHVPRRLQG